MKSRLLKAACFTSIILAAFFVAITVYASSLLHHNVVVEGDVVKLGDLFDNAGPNADTVVIRAPAPGKRIVLDTDWLQTIASRNRVNWQPSDLFEQAIVERAGIVVSREQIEQEVVKSVSTLSGQSSDFQIEWDSGRLAPIFIPVGTQPEIIVHDVNLDTRTQHFTAEIIVGVQGSINKNSSLRIGGKLYNVIEIPVASHVVNRGEIISAKDISWIKTRQASLRSDAATNIDQLIGMATRTGLRPNQIISTNDLQHPQTIQKGALVTMVLHSGAMTLSAQGRASEGGRIGDVIHVTNTHSNAVVEATIEAPNRVSIILNSSVALAN